jgi:hypothetical protein
MSSTERIVFGFIGFIATITSIVLTTLKYNNNSFVSHWSWLWVLSPLWVSASLITIVFVVFIIGVLSSYFLFGK